MFRHADVVCLYLVCILWQFSMLRSACLFWYHHAVHLRHILKLLPFIRLPNTSHICLFMHLFFCLLFLCRPVIPFNSISTLIAACSLSITSPKSSILTLTTFYMPLPSIHTKSSVNLFASVYNVASFNTSIHNSRSVAPFH